jgi:hypothetical protein
MPLTCAVETFSIAQKMRGLPLNDPKEHIANAYQEFHGLQDSVIAQLIAADRRPLSVAELLRRRLEVLSLSSEVEQAWWENDFVTPDAIIHNCRGLARIVTDATPITTIGPGSHYIDGALVLPKQSFETFSGPVFSHSELERYTGEFLTRLQAKTNPIWRALVAEDHSLLRAYVDAVFGRLESAYNTNHAMGVFPSAFPKTVTTCYFWRLRNYDPSLSSAVAAHTTVCRLVGVAKQG